MTTINHALDTIMQLDFYTREMLLEILQKRQIEERRKEIAHNVKTAKAAYRKGVSKPSTAHEMIDTLNAIYKNEFA